MLDKGRALIAGKIGEYKFDCPMDAHFLNFVGIKGADIKTLLEQGKGDGEVLDWINSNSPYKRRPEEIAAWSHYHNERGESDAETRDYFNGIHKQYGPQREDISSWFDLLDLDDYVSFGGKA